MDPTRFSPGAGPLERAGTASQGGRRGLQQPPAACKRHCGGEGWNTPQTLLPARGAPRAAAPGRPVISRYKANIRFQGADWAQPSFPGKSHRGRQQRGFIFNMSTRTDREGAAGKAEERESRGQVEAAPARGGQQPACRREAQEGVKGRKTGAILSGWPSDPWVSSSHRAASDCPCPRRIKRWKLDVLE